MGHAVPSVASAAELRSIIGADLEFLASEQADMFLAVCVEMVANAFDHGGGIGGFRVRHDRSRGLLAVEIDDFSSAHPRVVSGDPARLRGRGMAIVDGLTEWGVRRSRDGKTVWAVMSCVCRSSARCAAAAG